MNTQPQTTGYVFDRLNTVEGRPNLNCPQGGYVWEVEDGNTGHAWVRLYRAELDGRAIADVSCGNDGVRYHIEVDDDRPLTCSQSTVAEEAIANMVHDVFAVYRWALDRFGGCYGLG